MRKFRWLGVGLWACLCGAAAAQNNGGGVFIDGEGVLHARETKAIKLSGKGTPPLGLAYVSLPRLIAAAKGTDGELPPELATLGGMVRLTHVFVFPDEHDLVLAGPAEELSFSDPGRPLGKSTGRPALRLDDLAAMLRTVGRGQTAGVSIDLPENVGEILTATAARIGGIPGSPAGAAAALKKAVGPQAARLIGFPADTNAAYVCLEADYLMKRMGLGLAKSPVKGVKSHLAGLRQGDPMIARWWFHPRHRPLLVDPSGNAFEFRSRGMELRCSGSLRDNAAAASPAARAFAETTTEHFEALAAALPAYADMWNISDLGAFAALERKEGLAKRAGVDLSWLTGAGYALRKVPTPKLVETLVAHKKYTNAYGFSAGGVTMAAASFNVERETARDGAVAAAAFRPADSAWKALKPAAKQP